MKMKKWIAFLCVLALLTGILAGCNEEQQEPTNEPTGTPIVEGETTSYIITIKSIGGLPMSGLTLFVYEDSTLTNLEGYGQTDANGQAVISLPGSNDYHLVISNPPAGYHVEASYPMTGKLVNLTLTSQVISDTDISGVDYKLGDVMHDFEITDTDGNTYKLSELLKEKDMVMLNFWYTTCTWCITEFPFMDAAYQNYRDDVQIIGLNITDTFSQAKDFKDNFYDLYGSEGQTGGLDIPMAIDEAGFAMAFGLEAAPTSVIIDRYGVITMIHAGALVSEDDFKILFNAFCGDDYQQTIYNSYEEIVPVITPDVEMPSSDEIATLLNGGNIGITYAPEQDEEAAKLSWPFVIGQKDGVDCMYASNSKVTGSYATMYAYVTLEAGQALALDYFASSEQNADNLYILVDRNDVYQISGQSSAWNTCYPWVATETREYEVAFCYYKDGSTNFGDDTVYIKNLRIVDIADVDQPTYIPRFAATELKADGYGYENYITPVFNEEDGYYHVNDKNGPLLLANLMMPTRFSNDPVYTHIANGQVVIDGVNYYEQLINYCSYASNSQIYSLCPVNEELKDLLMKVTAAIGLEQSENEWLQMCEYYDAYGTGGVQLADPIKGLSAHSAYPAQLGTNSVYYDRMIMPRGLLYKFVPTKSGVYRITSLADTHMEGWIFDDASLANGGPFYTYWHNERFWDDFMNVSMVTYMEAGKAYYINIAFYDVEAIGGFDFTIEYEGAEKELLLLCSPGYFTYYVPEDGNEPTYDVIAGGIDVALGDDGYYHELLANGNLGSKIYLDMVSPSNIFESNSILELMNSGAFNFAITEDDQWILDYYAYFKEQNAEDPDFDVEDFKTCMQEVWGEDFEYYWDLFEPEDVLDGYYHGEGKDYTDVIRKYAEKIYKSGELEGCVEVNAELAEALQMLMDKYTFTNEGHSVPNSWIKLCYYYDYMGPDANK